MTGVSSTTALPNQLPAVDCAAWCRDGNGHVTEWHPYDQTCFSPDRVISLLRERPVDGALDNLRAYLVRERFEVEPYLNLEHGEEHVAKVTLAEARELIAALTGLVDAAERTGS